jgi:hypothetical protein
MNILDDLQNAFDKQDWTLIQKIYKDLSGKDLSSKNLPSKNPPSKTPPKKKATTKKTVAKKIATKKKRGRPPKKSKVPNVLPDLNIEIDTPPIKTNRTFESTNKLNNKQSYAQSKPLTGNFKNTFVDDQIECAEDSVKTDPKLGTSGRKVLSNNKNKKAKLIKVVCSQCNKTEMVSPILSTQYSENKNENRYRCNDCLISRK